MLTVVELSWIGNVNLNETVNVSGFVAVNGALTINGSLNIENRPLFLLPSTLLSLAFLMIMFL